jgi:hypothetical protein
MVVSQLHRQAARPVCPVLALSDEAPEPLSQRVVPSRNVRRQTRLLACGGVLLGGDDESVRLPEVAVAVAAAIGFGDRRP